MLAPAWHPAIDNSILIRFASISFLIMLFTAQSLPPRLAMNILVHWLGIDTIASLDSACCNDRARTILFRYFSSGIVFHGWIRCTSYNQTSYFVWLLDRNIIVNYIHVCKLSHASSKLLANAVLAQCHRALQVLEIEMTLSICRIFSRHSYVCLTHLIVNATLETWFSENPTDCDDASEEDLIDILRCNQRLGILSIVGLPSIGNKTLNAIGEYCRFLHSLTISGESQSFTDIGIDKIAVGCRQLQELTLSNTQHLSEAALVSLFEKCHMLSFLAMWGGTGFTDKVLFSLLRNALKLQWLVLRGCCHIRERGADVMIDCGGPQLKGMVLSDVMFSSSQMRRIRNSRGSRAVVTDRRMRGILLRHGPAAWE